MQEIKRFGFVSQREQFDCVICSIAMMCQLSYEEVMQIAMDLGAYDSKHGTVREQQILNKIGLVYAHADQSRNGWNLGDFLSVRDDRLPWDESTPLDWETVMWGRRALVSLPSLNGSGYHMIYWDGSQIWDPSVKKRYDTFDGIRSSIIEIILFRADPKSSFFGWTDLHEWNDR